MKKIMMIACMMLFSTAMFAEKGDMFVGAGLSYGIHSDYKNFGIGIKGQYEILTNFRADAQVDHFFKHDRSILHGEGREYRQWRTRL